MNRFRNLVLLLCLLFVLPILSACNDTEIAISSDPPIVTETTAAETTLSMHVFITPITYSSLEELLEVTDIVIIGTVQETLPAVRLTQSENTLWDSAIWEKFNVTPSLVQVEEVLKMEEGEVSVGDTFRRKRNPEGSDSEWNSSQRVRVGKGRPGGNLCQNAGTRNI